MIRTNVELIYQDDSLIVVNKPSGVSVTKDRSGEPQLTDLFSQQLGADLAGSLRLVHRLDKDTSGVMILAKNLETQTLFSGYFENRLIRKTYLALVTGFISADHGTIDMPLAEHPHKPGLMRIAAKGGKDAVTQWKLLADFDRIALLAVSPLTGRTHQVRMHLSAAGMPLAIDPLYGSGAPLFLSSYKTDYRLGKGKKEIPLMQRLTLHAYQLDLPQSVPLAPGRFIAKLDKKFTATLKMLSKYNPRGLDAFINSNDLFRIISAQPLPS